MAEIIPAILPKSLEDLREHLGRIRGAARAVQIDVVDGIFAPNKTWHSGDWKLETGDWKNKLPFVDEFEFEIDLMVKDAEDAAEAWRAAGAKRIVIHIESPDAREALMALRFEREESKISQGAQSKDQSFQSPASSFQSPAYGIALPSHGSADLLREYENLYDYAQVMGIEKVGFQGQPFDEHAIDLVRALRTKFPNLEIQVDGGVSEKNIRDLVAAGANRLVIGSAIWESENPREAINRLSGLANRTGRI